MLERHAIIALLAFFTHLHATASLPAETRTVTVPAGLIELRIQSPAGADVSWESRQPYDLVFRTYEGNNVCVFCQHTAGRLVVISDIIDWDARKRTKTTWVVNVGDTPGPKPPDPPDPPDPPEPDDIPDTVLNKYELGHAAYVAAKKIGNPAEAAALGKEFFAVARDLHQGRITTDTASKRVIAAREKLSDKWDAWEMAMQPKFNATVNKHGSGTLHYRDYFLEVSRALEAAGK